MSQTNTIEHSGIVKTIDDQHIVVSIISEAACVSCHAKGACSAADIKEKEIEILSWEGDFHIGEKVEIISSKSQGYRALWLAYLLPLIIMVTSLIILLNIAKDEAIAALGALITLGGYYFILYLLKEKHQNSLNFKIEKSKN